MKYLGAALAFVLVPGSAAAICDVGQIKSNVCELRSGYSPDAFTDPNKAYTKPMCSDTNVSAFTYQMGLLFQDSELRNTSNPVREEMCGLAKIFILPAGSKESWGKYEDSRYNQNGYNLPVQLGDDKSYIFLQRELFTSTGWEEIADRRLNSLKGKNGTPIGDLTQRPKHAYQSKGNTPKDQIRLALAYAVAHEIAHIKFHRDPVKDSSCFTDNIEGASWQPDSNVDRWRGFGDDVGKHNDNVPKPSEVDSADKLLQIYNGGFASALAAASKEEDYGESYTLAVLKAISTDDLNLDIGGTVVKLKERNGDQRLQAKLGCVLSVAAKQ
jgi:hypothetical protein